MQISGYMARRVALLAAALAAAADDGEGLLGERLAAVVDVCYEVRAAPAL